MREVLKIWGGVVELHMVRRRGGWRGNKNSAAVRRKGGLLKIEACLVLQASVAYLIGRIGVI